MCVIFFCLTWTVSVLSTSPTLVCVPPVSPPKSWWEHNRARWENKPCSTLCYCFLWDNKALFLLFLSPCIITQNSRQGHEVIMTCERFDSRCTCIVGCFTPNPAATHMIFSASLRKWQQTKYFMRADASTAAVSLICSSACAKTQST